MKKSNIVMSSLYGVTFMFGVDFIYVWGPPHVGHSLGQPFMGWVLTFQHDHIGNQFSTTRLTIFVTSFFFAL